MEWTPPRIAPPGSKGDGVDPSQNSPTWVQRRWSRPRLRACMACPTRASPSPSGSARSRRTTLRPARPAQRPGRWATPPWRPGGRCAP
eukprot:scaffold32217_cov87-Isochrysis_galbana.AAC.1